MELFDAKAEQAAVQILWEEARTFGAKRAAELLGTAGLAPEDFTVEMAAQIFARIVSATHQGLPPTLSNLEQGEEFLRSTEILNPVMLEAYAETIRSLSQRRAVVRVAQKLNQEARDAELSVPELIAIAERELHAVPSRASHWEPLTGTLKRVQAHIQEAKAGDKSPYVPSGFPSIDAETGGFPPTLVVIAAMPGVGKSAFEGAVLRNIAQRGETAAVFSMEDRSDWLAFRLLAHESGVDQFIMRNRALVRSQWLAVADSWNTVEGLGQHILCDDRPMLTPAEVLLGARVVIRKLGARIVFLDNMTAMRFGRGPRMDLEIQDFLTAARALADETGVPFVVLSHVKRRDELDVGDMPRLTDCSETSAFEKLSRLAYGLSRQKKTETLTVGVLKNTGGRAYVKFELTLRPSSALIEAELRRDVG